MGATINKEEIAQFKNDKCLTKSVKESFLGKPEDIKNKRIENILDKNICNNYYLLYKQFCLEENNINNKEEQEDQPITDKLENKADFSINENNNNIMINNNILRFNSFDKYSKITDDDLLLNNINNSFTYSDLDVNSVNSDFIDIDETIYFKKSGSNPFSKKSIFLPQKIKKNITLEKIRINYYDKLISSKIWNPSVKKKLSNNIFIFDWDDTLMCTTFLYPYSTGKNVKPMTDPTKRLVNSLDESVVILLKKVLEMGKVFIVTNAQPGWVEFSASKFYPKTLLVLREIPIVSSRGLCQCKYEGEPKTWKIHAFNMLINMFDIDKRLITNIIVLGDSINEMEAAKRFRDQFLNAYIKVVKFAENPTLSDLEKQIKLVTKKIDIYAEKFKNLNIKLYNTKGKDKTNSK